MTWAGRRQATILGAIAILVILILIPLLKPIIFPTPTCFDNNKNQSELGVDCSGPCKKICGAQASKVAVVWVRSFEVAPGVYSVVAYLSNPNTSYEAKKVPYTFKLYDDKSILLAERSGTTNIPAKTTLPIFEGGISVGKLKVREAHFELMGELDWQKSDAVTPKINVSSPIIESSLTPKVTVTIKNNNSEEIKNLPIVAIVFNNEGNAIAASRTIVDKLAKNESTEVSFTWLSPFAETVSRVEIYPQTLN